MKSWRQAQILEVVDQEPVTSQESLRQRLLGRGIGSTQATISRDLKELGLVKRAGDGAYVRPGSSEPTGRVYLDPNGEKLKDGLIRARLLGHKEAHELYG